MNSGTGRASDLTWGARSLDELNAWKLGNELRDGVHAEGRQADDWKFRNQLRDAVSSITRNVVGGVWTVPSPRVRALSQHRARLDLRGRGSTS